MNENIYQWLIGGLLSLVNLLFWSRIKRIEKDIDEVKQKTADFYIKNALMQKELLVFTLDKINNKKDKIDFSQITQKHISITYL